MTPGGSWSTQIEAAAACGCCRERERFDKTRAGAHFYTHNSNNTDYVCIASLPFSPPLSLSPPRAILFLFLLIAITPCRV